MNLPDDVTTLNEAARQLGVNPAMVYRWADQGKIPDFRIGHYRLFSLADVRRAVEAHSQRGTKRPHHSAIPARPVGINEAARLLGVPTARMQRLVAQYNVPNQKIGNVRIVDLDDARRVIEAHPSRAQTRGK